MSKRPPMGQVYTPVQSTEYGEQYRVKTFIARERSKTVIGAGGLIICGFVLLAAGAILSAVVYTEVRPPTADENYQRYIGADIRRILGPALAGLGLFMMIMACFLVGFSFVSSPPDEAVVTKTTRVKQAPKDVYSEEVQSRHVGTMEEGEMVASTPQ